MLNLTVRASETAFTDQLAQLLKALPVRPWPLALALDHKGFKPYSDAMEMLSSTTHIRRCRCCCYCIEPFIVSSVPSTCSIDHHSEW